MCDEHFTTVEEMVFAAQSFPAVSVEHRRRTLARSVRAYHERADRRRALVAATLLFGLVWMVGSAQQLLARPGTTLSDRNVAEEAESDTPTSGFSADRADEWYNVEQARRLRARQAQLLRRVLGVSQRGIDKEGEAV